MADLVCEGGLVFSVLLGGNMETPCESDIKGCIVLFSGDLWFVNGQPLHKCNTIE